jgi:hypothetical protein
MPNSAIQSTPTIQRGMLCAAAWESIEDNDELDVCEVVPRLLRLLTTQANMVSAHFMFLDSQKVNFDASVWNVKTFYVKDEHETLFKWKSIQALGVLGLGMS